MKKVKSHTFFIVLFSFVISTLSAQKLSLSVATKIDSLFNEFNAPNTPGCAIGIVRNDSLIYAKGYGLSNLEYDIPITPKTMFYMASVSKQFTAYSIVQLSSVGKLKLEDDIHIYLPWFPDLKRKITIRHLLNHSSGLRDDLDMAEYGGLGDGSIVSQELALKYIKNSRALNFEPGEKYLYSNSNYVLLAEIVKEISGKSFKTFTDSALFRPLGMKNSFFLDQPYELIKNRATSYYKIANHYRNAIHNVFTLGDGGMFSNIEDLSKWVMNFFNPTVGNAEDIIQFTQNGVLNDSSKIPYALGITVNKYKGFKQFTHGGALAGYRTNIAVFPEIKMAFIILSNNGSVNASAKSNQLADNFLKNYPTYIALNAAAKILINDSPIEAQTAKALIGNYISDDGLQYKFFWNGQSLFCESRGSTRRLYQTAKETFEDSLRQMKFKFFPSVKDTIIQQSFTGYYRILTKYTPESSFIKFNAKKYTGTYFSPELEARVDVVFKEGQLILMSLKYGELKLKTLDSQNVIIESSGSHIKFLISASKEIEAFELNSQRMMHVRFDKVK